MKTGSHSERRSRRSHDPIVALDLYLERLAARNEISAVVVSDPGGRFVAGSGLLHDLEGLGQLGASVAHSGVETPDFDFITRGEDFYASRMDVRGRSFVLSSVGGRVRKLVDTKGTIERILSLAS
ncbi:MAG: hypothetical protein KBF88_14010 [Polyangiaceae bacterium]|nr:hypothetical protein [Polyangiaceae bacterium]